MRKPTAFPFALVIVIGALSSCGNDGPQKKLPADVGEGLDASSQSDVRPSDAAAGDGAVEDAALVDGPAAVDVPGDGDDATMTPSCAPTGGACGGEQRCCAGSSCEGGVCEVVRNCVPAGNYCTRQTASNCCSGQCDGDSCIAGLGGRCNDRGCLWGSECIAGTCQCPARLLECGSRCADPMYDNAHCGACNSPCGAEQRCLEGTCECNDSFATRCGLECVDLRTDEAHCGDCDNACPPDRSCGGGTCQCTAPLRECGGACIPVDADPVNCGGCGVTCAADEMCSSGNCVCATGLSRCPGGVCLDLQNDELNCGTCGNQCRRNQVCQSGTCQ